jgi:hypothetical protein
MRVCKRTGLTLRPADELRTWRIQKTSFGPMTPLQRPVSAERGQWGRYDTAGHRTIYTALPVDTAYAESLAQFRPKFTKPLRATSTRPRSAGLRSRSDVKLVDLFDDLDSDEASLFLIDQIEAEWIALGHMKPTQIAAIWRQDRRLYEVALPREGWFVDVEAAESVATLSAALGAKLADFELGALTVGDLRGENRGVTTLIADWIRAQVLDDGSLPHGIYFGSKHGSQWCCWAVWLRAVDAGLPVTSEPTTADDGIQIDPPDRNPPLKRVCRLFRLAMF